MILTVKKLTSIENKCDFIYKAKGFQVCEKTLIKMLYVDAISVLKEIQKTVLNFINF